MGGLCGPVAYLALVERSQEHVVPWPFCPDLQVPDELQDKEFAAVLQEEPLQPLALEPLTEEEQVGLGWVSCGLGHWGSLLERGWFGKADAGMCSSGQGGGSQVPGSSLPPLTPSSEKLLPVSEQCGCAEADGKRGCSPARWHLPWQGQYSEPR